MAGESAKHSLVSFENVSASVGGYDISSIVELRLAAATNSVPSITLLVDVASGDQGEASEAVSLANARQAFDNCRDMVRTDGATLSLSLTCKMDGPNGSDTQSLSLRGWLLTDVALSSIQRHGVCTASLTFQHPLCKAHLGGAVPMLVAVPPLFDNVEDGNPFAVFIRALRMYESSRRLVQLPAAIPGASSPEEVRGQLLTRLSRATSDLESGLAWRGGGLPAYGYLAGWTRYLCSGIAQYASPGGGNSVLQALLGGLVPECSLAVGGDYTQSALEIGPFEPWAESSLAMSDSDIVSLDFPQTDPSPISGVSMIMSNVDAGSGVSYHPIGCQMGSASYPAETFYIPESEFNAQYLYGPIQQFSAPAWLSSMAAFEHSLSDGTISDAAMAPLGGVQLAVNTPRGGGASFGPGGGASSPGMSSSLEYAQAMLACAKAYFETSLMKDWVFTATSRFMVTTDGGILCPGRVIRVNAGSSEVLGGYVVGVEHVISVPNKHATTRVTCTHPRFGSLPAAITSPRNALYT